MKKILVVGGGLAGSSLAFRLEEEGVEVTVLDSGVNHSTAIAAGMVNPMVFRRMNKSWRLDEFMAEAKIFYQALEQKFKASFFHPITIRRMFSSEQERDFWLQRQALAEYQDYLETVTSEDEQYTLAKNDFGSGRVKNAFWVHALSFYEGCLSYFETKGAFMKETFDLTVFDQKKGAYKGVTYDAVVFATGYRNPETPFFQTIPVEQTKGQVLTIRSNELPENESLNRKCFVLPISEHTFRVGATYEWKNADLSVSEEGFQLLENNLRFLSDAPFELVEQLAGIRPTSKDRRPFMGKHPDFDKLYIFNGLGTKGYMMAPLLSKEMANYILYKKALHPETDLARL